MTSKFRDVRARAYVNLHMNGLPLRPDRQTKPRMCPLSPDGDANEHEQGHDNGVLHCLPRHKIPIFASPHPCTTHTLPRLTFAACLMLAHLIAVLCERQRVFLVGIFLDSRAAWRRHFSPRSFTSFGLDLVPIQLIPERIKNHKNDVSILAVALRIDLTQTKLLVMSTTSLPYRLVSERLMKSLRDISLTNLTTTRTTVNGNSSST